jgi:hypothetical protein
MGTPSKKEVNNANRFLPAKVVTIEEDVKGGRSCQATISKVFIRRKELFFTEALPDWVNNGCLIILEK